MTTSDRQRVADWLTTFDTAADVIPEPRRSALRSELLAHLDEAIAADATDDDVAGVLEELGSPHAIVEEELTSPSSPEPRRRFTLPRPRRRSVITAIAAVAAFGVFTALGLNWVLSEEPTLVIGEPRNVVTTFPAGPERVTDGRGYQEYLAQIDTLPELPHGASWPEGVPRGLDAGPIDDGTGVMGAGGGATTANFTWACAWEYEYLLAEKAGDDARLVAAYNAIVEFGDSPMMKEASPDGGWISGVIGPLTFEDTTGLKRDVVQSCGQAGITGVYNLVYHPES